MAFKLLIKRLLLEQKRRATAEQLEGLALRRGASGNGESLRAKWRREEDSTGSRQGGAVS